MRLKEFLPEQADVRDVVLVIKSSESRPGMFRVINRHTRDILGTFHSVADLVRIIDPRRLPGSSVTIQIPPALQRQYPDFAASIIKFAPAMSQTQRRPVTAGIMDRTVTEEPDGSVDDRAPTKLQEFSTTEDSIKDVLQDRGYRFLGQGVDQMAFREPGTGQVLKIFGTQCTGSEEDPRLSDDQKMFKLYAEFCAKNSNNPYLPRIYGWDTFVYPTQWGDRKQRCLYLQIRTEPLKHFDNRWYRFFERMAQSANWGTDFRTFHEDMEAGDVYDIDEHWYQQQTNNPQAIQRMAKLYHTMQALAKIADKHSFGWDLHGNNIMKRSDGTPVITDPWVL